MRPSASPATTPSDEVERRADGAERHREQRRLAQPARDPRAARRPPAHRAVLHPGCARAEPEPGRAEHREQRPHHHAERERTAPARERAHDHRQAHQNEQAAQRPGRGQVSPLHAADLRRAAPRGAAARRRVPGEESMITRHGPIGQHRLEGLPEQAGPGPPRRQRHDDRPRLDLARLLRRCAARARRRAPSPSGRSPAARRSPAPSRSPPGRAPPAPAGARRSAALAGTVIVTSTWIPRRRGAASFAAVDTASRRVVRVLEGHQHRLVLHLVLDRRLGHHHLARLGQRQSLAAAVHHVQRDSADQPEQPGDQHADVEHGGDDQRDSRAEAAEDREQRQLVARARGCCPAPSTGRSWSGCLTRSAITAAWAIVNESIAPNA